MLWPVGYMQASVVCELRMGFTFLNDLKKKEKHRSFLKLYLCKPTSRDHKGIRHTPQGTPCHLLPTISGFEFVVSLRCTEGFKPQLGSIRFQEKGGKIWSAQVIADLICHA